jgi:hypothetical protein
MCGNKGNIGSDKTKINCQCDGNCNCGEILPNGKISCDNCGWKAPEAYNALTGNYVCPSCRTESSYSSNSNNKPKNKNMNNQNNNIPQTVVAAGSGNSGLLLWADEPFGGSGPVTESNFEGNNNLDRVTSQGMVGFGAGQDWALMNPFQNGSPESGFAEGYEDLSDEDKKWADLFYSATDESSEAEESGLFNFFKAAARGPFCGRVCKSLGYMRSEDKTAFKKCKNSCSTVDANFQKAKQGRWNYPAAPSGVEQGPSPAQIAADSAKDAAVALKSGGDQLRSNLPPGGDLGRPDDTTTTPAKSNMMMYVIIGVVALAIIIAIIIMMKKRAAAKA